jgi:hypothetical protein
MAVWDGTALCGADALGKETLPVGTCIGFAAFCTWEVADPVCFVAAVIFFFFLDLFSS